MATYNICFAFLLWRQLRYTDREHIIKLSDSYIDIATLCDMWEK